MIRPTRPKQRRRRPKTSHHSHRTITRPPDEQSPTRPTSGGLGDLPRPLNGHNTTPENPAAPLPSDRGDRDLDVLDDHPDGPSATHHLDVHPAPLGHAPKEQQAATRPQTMNVPPTLTHPRPLPQTRRSPGTGRMPIRQGRGTAPTTDHTPDKPPTPLKTNQHQQKSSTHHRPPTAKSDPTRSLYGSTPQKKTQRTPKGRSPTPPRSDHGPQHLLPTTATTHHAPDTTHRSPPQKPATPPHASTHPKDPPTPTAP